MNNSFRKSDNVETADLVISFASGTHSPPDGDTFDGEGGVLAHAWYPPTGMLHL